MLSSITGLATKENVAHMLSNEHLILRQVESVIKSDNEARAELETLIHNLSHQEKMAERRFWQLIRRLTVHSS